MIPSILSRLVILLFGTLYPAYSSYKAVRTKNVKEYVKWMMYWIVYALFTCAETFTDVFLSFWFPFYYEFKIILVVYLLSPATNGSSILYKKFVHPVLTKKEQDIDECIAKALEQGYHTMFNLGSRSIAYATSIIMQTALKGGGGIVNHIRKSYSLDSIDARELRSRRREMRDESDAGEDEDGVEIEKYLNFSSKRTISSGSQVDLRFTDFDDYNRPLVPADGSALSHVRSSEDISSGYSSRLGYRDQLVRNVSMGPNTRQRTRGMSKKVNSAEEDELGCATMEPDESQCKTDDFYVYPPPPSLSIPLSGNFIAPFARPEHRYLFGNLTQHQLFPFINNATCSLPAKLTEIPAPGERVTEVKFPGDVLKSILAEEPDRAKSSRVQGEESRRGKPKASGKSGSDVGEELFEKSTRSGKYNKLPAPVPPNEERDFVVVEEEEAELAFCTPESSPVCRRKNSDEKVEAPPGDKPRAEIVKSGRGAAGEPAKRSSSSGKGKGKGKMGDSNISKMLHLPRIQFPFWSQKNGKHPSGAEGSAAAVSRANSQASLPYISPKGGTPELRSKGAREDVSDVNVREMSQSPSSKRRFPVVD